MLTRKQRTLLICISIFLPVLAALSFPVVTQAQPIAIINSPQNKIYTSNTIAVSITTQDQFTTTGYYSIDGEPETRINEGGGTYKTTLNLPDGLHTINVRVEGFGRNTATVTFRINTTIPFVTLLSPENKEYNTSAVPLHFSVFDDSVTSVIYNLDNTGNVTARVLIPDPPRTSLKN
ncbi:MAG: hypothetical protein NWE98_04480 [Candidatus Bathyarchaeota archaeon]|nr:hypothetical protein [Candidatus Bathyarchaeota archaeon]